KAGVLLHLLKTHAGVEAAHAHAVVWCFEVEHTQVADHPADLVKLPRGWAQGAGAVVAHAAHHVHLLYEHPAGVLRHPVARRVADGVTRRATHAEQLSFRLGEGADARDVLVAVAIDLGGAHHHVAPPVPHHVEHR